jgi:hypothetical protein
MQERLERSSEAVGRKLNVTEPQVTPLGNSLHLLSNTYCINLLDELVKSIQVSKLYGTTLVDFKKV